MGETIWLDAAACRRLGVIASSIENIWVDAAAVAHSFRVVAFTIENIWMNGCRFGVTLEGLRKQASCGQGSYQDFQNG